MASLFRREALEHRQGDWLGSVHLARPLSLTLMTAVFVALAIALALWLTKGEYTRKARITGYLVPDRGVIRLVAPQSAVVLESLASEGRSVRQGDVLFVLSLAQATASGDAQAAVQASLAARARSLAGSARQQAAIDQERLAALDRQLDDRRREQAQVDAEIELQQQRLALAEQAHQRAEALRGENFVSPAQVQAKAEELLAVRAQLRGLERQKAAQQRELNALVAQRREQPLVSRNQQGAIERDIAEIAQQAAETEAKRQVVVRAPQDGVVTGLRAEPGQSVSAAATLANLLPASAQLQAQLYAPSSAIGFIRPEQPVNLRYEAFPYQKFGHQSGRVLQVSRSPIPAAELGALSLPAAQATSVEPLYRVTVALERQSVPAYGQAQPLAAGMQLDADVLLDRRRLVEWLFEPLLGLAGRV